MTSVVFIWALTSFIASNPGFISWLLGGLVTALVGLLVGYYGFIGHRISKLEETDHDLVNRVVSAEKSLEAYKEHIGAGDKELAEINSRMTQHMDTEEKEIWGGMRELRDMLTAMKLENMEAHASIGERLIKVETKMPNGEIQKMALLVKELVSDQERRYHEGPRDEKTRLRRGKRSVKK